MGTVQLFVIQNNKMKTLIISLMLLGSIKSNSQGVNADMRSKSDRDSANGKLWQEWLSPKDSVVGKSPLQLLGGGVAVFSSTLWDNPEKDLILKVKYDTTILFKGDIKCEHQYATKDVRNGMFSNGYISCAVYHGLTGCPDNWQNVNYICTKCFRHFNVKENRWTEKKLNEYDEALERFNKLHPKKP